MNKIILLGNSAVQIAGSESSNLPENHIILADTFSDSISHLKEGKADILLISRDAFGFNADELFNMRDHRGEKPLCIIWPPDESLISVISSFLTHDSAGTKGEMSAYCEQSQENGLSQKNKDLTERITALEAVVRSLLSALSQYDLSYEVYAGEDDAWKLIMQGLPAAEILPDDSSSDEYDDLEEEYDGTEGN